MHMCNFYPFQDAPTAPFSDYSNGHSTPTGATDYSLVERRELERLEEEIKSLKHRVLSLETCQAIRSVKSENHDSTENPDSTDKSDSAAWLVHLFLSVDQDLIRFFNGLNDLTWVEICEVQSEEGWLMHTHHTDGTFATGEGATIEDAIKKWFEALESENQV